jgi:hypothetical protein
VWSDRPVVAVQSVTLPDVYMCLPADVVAKFVTKDKNPKAEYEACIAAGTKDNCNFTMIDGSKVSGTYDRNGWQGESPFLDDGKLDGSVMAGATLQIRSGFGSLTAARPEVPLYSMESYDLKTQKGVADPPVEELFLGGYGYNCTDKYCPGYALASNTPWPLLFTHVPLSACSSTDLTHLAPGST